eukprot:TRINITY_DN4798_c0_g1_i1.p1 TRINITY_DN4798_c0_g1~~TRINITY_DN4798_c0_g1_i1.p1  ORF type:complete len:235 (-),score=60.85 TRINITY_DN4798_c0_g1_i1:72-722(-)
MEATQENAEDVPMVQFDKLKKKKKVTKKKKAPTTEATAAEGAEPTTENAPEGEAKVEEKKEEEVQAYNYEFLLERAFSLIGKSGADSKSVKVPLPQAYLVGTKKTLWANFPTICKAVQRNPQHLLTYVCIELGTTANLDGRGGLVITGRFMLKQLESLLRSYIAEYVKCKTCGTRDTTLKKENRLYFVECNSSLCGSKRTVPALNKGYVHALKRKK